MRRELLLIGEMIEVASEAQSLVDGIDLATLSADRQRRDALLWNFTVLGEAETQLDDEVKERFPEIPWAQPARLRNRVIHGYWSIDLQILHTTATDLLPQFGEQLQAALEALEGEEGGDPSSAETVSPILTTRIDRPPVPACQTTVRRCRGTRATRPNRRGTCFRTSATPRPLGG